MAKQLTRDEIVEFFEKAAEVDAEDFIRDYLCLAMPEALAEQLIDDFTQFAMRVHFPNMVAVVDNASSTMVGFQLGWMLALRSRE